MRTSCVGLVPGVKTSELRSGDGDSGCVGGWAVTASVREERVHPHPSARSVFVWDDSPDDASCRVETVSV